MTKILIVSSVVSLVISTALISLNNYGKFPIHPSTDKNT